MLKTTGDLAEITPASLTVSFWRPEPKALIDALSSSNEGLAADNAADRLKVYGPNTLKSAGKKSALLLFLSQFKSPLTLLLIIASLLSAGLGDVTDTIIIFIIVLISGVLGFLQEHSAANAVNELLNFSVANQRSSGTVFTRPYRGAKGRSHEGPPGPSQCTTVFRSLSKA